MLLFTGCQALFGHFTYITCKLEDAPSPIDEETRSKSLITLLLVTKLGKRVNLIGLHICAVSVQIASIIIITLASLITGFLP